MEENPLTLSFCPTLSMNVPRLPSLLSHEIKPSITHPATATKRTHTNRHTLVWTSTNKQQINPKKRITNQLRAREMDPQLVLSWDFEWTSLPSKTIKLQLHWLGSSSPSQTPGETKADTDTHGWRHYWGCFNRGEAAHCAPCEGSKRPRGVGGALVAL